MIKRYGYLEPPFIEEKVLSNNQKQRIVNFDVRKIESGEYAYCWRSVTLEAGVWSYKAIISAIVRERYSADDVEAILCNRIADPSDKEYEHEFNKLKHWRIHAKAIASLAIKQTKFT